MSRHWIAFGAMQLAVVFCAAVCSAQSLQAVPAHLPGELSAEQVLNGEYPFPPSPAVKVSEDWSGFATERLTKVPAPGVHPRILLSPQDLPDLRRRLKETATGRALYATLQQRLDATLRNRKSWGSELYERLSAGDLDGAKSLIAAHNGLPASVGHYQPWFYAVVLEAFDSMVTGDATRGKKAAAAISTYASLVRPGVERALAGPMNDDVWRAKVAGSVTGSGDVNQGAREALGYHLMGYAYDCAYGFMDNAQRDNVRSLIAKVTAGRVWDGARLPHHFRNWNHITVALSQPLLALSIEGESGYDPRVYKLGVQIARDYLTYGISEHGASTEAIGYTQFGLVWGNPFIVAAARRGDNLLVQSHHRAMIDWYLASLEPSGDRWTSHGDGGDTGPAIWTLSMWRYFYPHDKRVDILWQALAKSSQGKPFEGTFHLIEPLLWATDSTPDAHAASRQLGLPLTWFDDRRSSLVTRNSWDSDTGFLEFECRTDSVGASHEHADRGSFTFSALGRSWAKDNFRSVETRHHNSVLIDGMGQGYWPGPAKWLGMSEERGTLIASCDLKDNYSWWWPKEIITESPQSFLRFNLGRWESYRKEAEAFQQAYGATPKERDTRPSVVAFWKGYDKTDPRLWDEDTWPVRLPHNPVERAFRTIAFTRGAKPSLLVIDDIQKDEQERLYEWLLQTGLNTEVVSINGNDILLTDATVKRDANGEPRPARGDRELLVRVLDLNNPAHPHDYQSRPSFRLETFERRDTLTPDAGPYALAGSRSFGPDKRLVIASRSAEPDFKVLLVPMRHGDSLPVTSWNADRSQLTIQIGTERTVLQLKRDSSGLTLVTRLEDAN